MMKPETTILLAALISIALLTKKVYADKAKADIESIEVY